MDEKERKAQPAALGGLLLFLYIFLVCTNLAISTAIRNIWGV
jgi:hypothetical protein